MIHPDELTSAQLANVINEEIDCINVHQRGLYQIDLNGLPRIADAIAELFAPQSVPMEAGDTRPKRWAVSS
jgi:predicted glycosyltransferase